MEIKGIIKVIKPIQEVSATFSKREFVIETDEQYKQVISLELHGDKVDIIDAYTEGQEVKCFLNLRGRMWTNPQGEEKYFNTIVCWGMQPIKNAPTQEPQQSAGNQFLDPNFNTEDSSDLPF